MECGAPPTTYEEAIRDIPNSVIPIKGLRRDDDGLLSPDAQNIILDGLRSRGMDMGIPEQRDALVMELERMMCMIGHQYDFLMKDFREKLRRKEPLTLDSLRPLRERNQLLLDLMTVSRRVSEVPPRNEGFVEGFQGTVIDSRTQVGTTGREMSKLLDERGLLQLDSSVDMREHAMELGREKNRRANTMLGMYGFLNLVTVGLLLYLYRA